MSDKQEIIFSLSFKHGRAFFEKGARAFAHVFGGEQLAEQFSFERESFLEREFEAARDGFEASANSERRL